jgi:hypothetical protein
MYFYQKETRMKDKFKQILIEHGIQDTVAQSVSEAIEDGVSKYKKENGLLKMKLEESVKRIATLQESHKQELVKINTNWKRLISETKTQVEKVIKEDYDAYKRKLVEKTKNVLKENVSSLKTVIREQLEEETIKGSAQEKLRLVAEAVQPLFKETKVDNSDKLIEESKSLKTKLDEVSEASKKLEQRIMSREQRITMLLAENKKLKEEMNKPLREQVGAVKVAKQQVTEDVEKEQLVDNNDIMNEMRYLAGDLEN